MSRAAQETRSPLRPSVLSYVLCIYVLYRHWWLFQTQWVCCCCCCGRILIVAASVVGMRGQLCLFGFGLFIFSRNICVVVLTISELLYYIAILPKSVHNFPCVGVKDRVASVIRLVIIVTQVVILLFILSEHVSETNGRSTLPPLHRLGTHVVGSRDKYFTLSVHLGRARMRYIHRGRLHRQG